MNSPSGGRFNLGNVLVYSAAFVIVIAGLQAAASILIPVLLAVFITIVLTPAYFSLQRWMNPTIALTVLIFGLVVASFGLVTLVGNAVDDFTAKKETYVANLTQHSDKLFELVNRFKGVTAESTDTNSTGEASAAIGPDSVVTDTPPPAEASAPSTNDIPVSTNAPAQSAEGPDGTPLKKTGETKAEGSDIAAKVQALLTENSEKILNYAGAAAGIVGAMLGNTFLIVMIAIFLLLEAASLPNKIRSLPGVNDETWDRLTKAVTSVRHYTELKTGLSLLTGFLCWIMLAWLGVEYAILFGLLAFILNYVPNIGSLIAAVPAVLIAWLGAPPENGLTQAAIVGVGYIVINTVVGNIIEPKVLDKGLGLSASIIVVTMVFWGWVLGPVGMLLSVPLTMIAKIAMEASSDTQWVGAMMGSEEAEPPPAAESSEKS